MDLPRRPQRHIFLASLPSLLIALATIGCGGDPTPPPANPLHPVKGTVKLETSGSLAGMKIVFQGKTPGARPASGDLKADGSFDLTTTSPGDGIAEGEYYVHFEKIPVPGKVGKESKPTLPAAYTDPESTSLTATISPTSTTVGPIVLKPITRSSGDSRD